MRRPSLKLFAIAGVAAAAVLAGALFVLLRSDGGTNHPEDPQAFLQRVEHALREQGEIPHVTAEATVTEGVTTFALWSSEAWYDFEAGAVRSAMKKAPGSTIDIADEVEQLRTSDAVYDTSSAIDEITQRLPPDERPACFYRDEPPLLVMGLLCGLGPQEGDPASMAVESITDFRGRGVRSLAAEMTDGRVLRLLVDLDTYLPVGQTMTGETAMAQYVMETAYQVETVARSTLPTDFFDPRSLGYVPQEEVWLRILDDLALGVRVYWPGRALIGTGQYDAVLTRVEDRRGPPDKNAPGHVLSLDYEGASARFRLDYWPGQTWDDMLQLLGGGFLWASCSETAITSVPAGEVTILRGFEPEAGIEALRPPQVGAPGTNPTSSVPPFDPFPDGCPEGEYDRFMAVIRIEDAVVTINLPYGLCCQDGDAFGVYDTEAGLLAIAERLRLRQPGE